MLELIHLSDPHLFVPYGLHKAVLDFTSKIQHIPVASLLPHPYSYAFEQAKDELPNALRRNVRGGETLLVMTGDIAAMPYDSVNDINNVYHDYVSELGRASGSVASVAILGNHDWALDGTSPFHGSNFNVSHRVTTIPRRDYFRGSTATLVFFFVDSTTAILPATGLVPDTTLDYLRECFDQGHRGPLIFDDGQRLSRQEYDDALKIIVLHHFPLPRAAYGRQLSWWKYLLTRLKNGDRLLDTCKGQVDVFLFGHSHLPRCATFDGMVLIDTGSTLATDSGYSPLDAQFQLIEISDTQTIMLKSFRWEDGPAKTFMPLPTIGFERSATGLWTVQ